MSFFSLPPGVLHAWSGRLLGVQVFAVRSRGGGPSLSVAACLGERLTFVEPEQGAPSAVVGAEASCGRRSIALHCADVIEKENSLLLYYI